MLVTLSRARTAVADVSGSATWRAAPARQFGQAQFYIPRDSTLWDASLFDEDGGSLVRIAGEGIDDWCGVVRTAVYQPDGSGVTITALDYVGLASTRIVPPGPVFRNLTAGVIVKAAIRSALPADGPLRLGTIAEGPPLVPEYQFTGQSLAQVLTDLSDRTGQEWRLRGELLDWGPPAGVLTPIAWEEGSLLVTVERQSAGEPPATEVIARGAGGETASVRLVDETFWQTQRLITVGSSNPVLLGLAAQAAMEADRPAKQYRATVQRTRLATLTGGGGTGLGVGGAGTGGWGDTWGSLPWCGIPGGNVTPSQLAVGDYVRLVLPHDGLSGTVVPARIIERTLRSDAATLDLLFLEEGGRKVARTSFASALRQLDSGARLAV